MNQEKRRFTRVPFGVKAEMLLENLLYNAEELLNLSVGGCLLPIKADFSPGTPCLIRILLSGTNNDLSVKVEGEVIRCDGDGVAVKFTYIDPDSLFHLQRIIRYNASDPEEVEKEQSRYPTPFQ